MNTFCPFFKETCKGNECVMWRDEACLIVSFLQIASEGVPSPEQIMETSRIEIHREEAEVPDWIKTRTAEELAVEILEFKKKEFPEDEYLGLHTISNLFWEKKGIEHYQMPSEIRLKINRANILARTQIHREAEKQKKEQMQKEKEELPSLVSHCIDWARTNGVIRLTLADIDAYIFERNLDILKETRRALYAMANVQLKSKR